MSQVEERDAQGSRGALFTLTLLENKSAGQEGFTVSALWEGVLPQGRGRPH